MSKLLIAGKDCKDCVYLSQTEDKNKIYCACREKTYVWGGYVACEDKEVRK